MAQSGFTPIQLFRTTTAAAVPTAGDLAAGELAINLTDEALYFKNAAGVVTLLADSSGALGTVTSVDVSGGTTGLTTSGGPITSSGTITLAGTLGVANGGTGATTFTANGVVYGNTTSALLVTAAGTTGQVLVGNTGGAPSWATLTGIGVTSFSGGTTGLTPNTATTGAVTLAGTLGVANGGTGTATAFTAGSVVFAGASGVYSQDNANLFWDNTNDRLGIGTATPAAKIEIRGGGFVGSSFNGQIFSDFDAPRLQIGYQNNAITTGLVQAQILADTTNLQIASRDDVNGIVTFRTGSGIPERMRIDASGNVGIGTSSQGMPFEVVKNGTDSGLGYSNVSKFADGAGNKGLVIGYDNSAQTTVLTANSTAASSNMAFWTYDAGGSGWGERMRISSAGLVGIGTAAPSVKLEVLVADGAEATKLRGATGRMRIRPYVDATNGSFIDAVNTAENAYIPLSLAGSSIRLTTNGGLAATVDASGNVGIGTTSPNKWPITKTLTVNASSGYAGFELAVADTLTAAFIATTTETRLAARGASNNMTFEVNTIERMRIDTSGNVGIGTSSPASTAVAAGSLTVNGVLAVKSYLSSNQSDAGIIEYNSGKMTLRPYGATAGSGYLAFNTGGGGGTADAERMRIDSSGNVVIGSTSAIGNFSVVTPDGVSARRLAVGHQSGYPSLFSRDSDGTTVTSGFWDAQQQIFTNAGTERMRIDSSGNVGIGNSAPGATLTLQAANNFPFIHWNNSSNTQIAFAGWHGGSGGGGDFRMGTVSTTAFAFQTNNAERMRIDSTGKFQVGTTSSAYSGANAISEAEGGSFAASLLSNTGGISYATLYVFNKSTSGDNELVQFGTEGTWTGRGSITYNRVAGLVAYNTTSDYRAKDIIGSVTDAGETIDALKVYKGVMKGATQSRPMLIAHEAQEVTPYAVTGEKDAVNEDGTDKYQQIDHSTLIPLLIAEIQSLRARVAQLEGN
jgi:hypothetical protein